MLRMFIMACSSFRMAGGSQIAQKGKRGNFSTGTSDRKIQIGDICEKRLLKSERKYLLICLAFL